MAEIWVLNEEPVFSQEYLSFDAVFTTDNIEMCRIKIEYTPETPEVPGSPIKNIRYTQKALNGMVPNIYIAYDSSTGGWDNIAYRTLVFETAPTGDLLTWLQTNGTKQETDTSKKLTKLKYKASDVCQLLDKSKYPTTREIAGITFTNNGDGSFTMSGTRNGNAQLEISVADFKKGHKYLGTTGTDTFYLWFFKPGTSIYGEFIRSPFYTATETDTDIRFFIKTDSTDAVNVTAYPQLFDLTEMYGAGNEPTTLAEFRQKYSNDLYPYSPLCWYSINKTRYMSNKYGNIDLSTLEWSKEGLNFVSTPLPNAKIPTSDVAANMICSKYRSVPLNNSFVEGDFAINPLGWLYVRDTKYGDIISFKESLKDLILTYELATDNSGGYLSINKGVKI